jgi:hypothetical protein
MTWLMVPEKAQMAPGFFQSSSPSSIHSITSFDVKRVCPNMGHLISSLMEWPYIGAIIGVVYPILRHTLISYIYICCIAAIPTKSYSLPTDIDIVLGLYDCIHLSHIP